MEKKVRSTTSRALSNYQATPSTKGLITPQLTIKAKRNRLEETPKVERTKEDRCASCELNGDTHRCVERNIEVVRANEINAEVQHW